MIMNPYVVRKANLGKQLICCFLFLAGGCSPDYSHFEPDPQIEGRIMDQLRADPDFSTFTEALELTGMDEFINRSGLWTVIAPTNQAFIDAGVVINDMSEVDLSKLIGFHILERMMFTFDFAASKFSSNVKGRYATRSRKFVTVSAEGNAINGIPLIESKKDIAARNGAIHGIGQVMFPDPSIDDYLGESNDLQTFFSLLQHFAEYQVDGEYSVDRDADGVIDDTVFRKLYLLPIDLANEPAIKTVYAPNNAAFQAFFSDPQVPYSNVNDFDLSNPIDHHVLSTLLKGHLVAGIQPATGAVRTSGEETVTITSEDVQTDNVAQSNGVVHVLNKVIVPPSLKSVAGRALMDRELSKFAASLIKSSLINAFAQSDGVFTLFAPTNAAFERAGIDPAKQDITPLFLNPILRYHLVTGIRLQSGDMVNKSGYLPTSNNTFLKYENTGLMDNSGSIGAITTANLEANNGIVHKIDNILMPPSKTVVQLVLERPEFSQFRAALSRAGLLSELEQAGITVFAPDNEAFFAMYSELNAPGGLTDIGIPRLDSILRYHLIPTRVFSSDMTEATSITTKLAGQHLMVKVASGDVFLMDGDATNQDAFISDMDNQGTNGVMHKINAVLLPKEY